MWATSGPHVTVSLGSATVNNGQNTTPNTTHEHAPARSTSSKLAILVHRRPRDERRPMSVPYDVMLGELVDEAKRDEDVIGLLLTGSLARGDALPGTDIDLRLILADGLSRPRHDAPRDGILVERGYADEPAARANLESDPMHVYAYLDGRILYDSGGVLTRLRQHAQHGFDTYRVTDQQKSDLAQRLRHPRREDSCRHERWRLTKGRLRHRDRLLAAHGGPVGSQQPATAPEQLSATPPAGPVRSSQRGEPLSAALSRRHATARSGRAQPIRLGTGPAALASQPPDTDWASARWWYLPPT
ncbi:MAG: hypothetical protein GEV10_06335 [Streptosporangiales bacterium]|nr:hypothetical protein [Streptosporangiales bacterium]